MNKPEAITLCRLAKAACPQQAIDEYTPDAWFELLGDLRFEDAKEALFNVCRVQPFVAPAEIRDAVKRLRHARIDAFGPFDPPPELDPKDYSPWLADMLRRIGDGDLTDPAELEPPDLTARELPPLDGVMPRVPAEYAKARAALRRPEPEETT